MNKETSDDNMKHYITSKGVNEIELIIVSNPNATFKSYKLSVPVGEINKYCRLICGHMVYVFKNGERTGNRDAKPQTLKHGRNEHTFV